MSEQEFDLYLRLMSRLLKLSQEQERAIADELRDHMEERFAELIRAGLTREQAIERALMEFGDAASLAGEFSGLVAKRRRRFWGRLSLAGTGAAALVTVGLVSFWPAARPMNAPNQTVSAQEKGIHDSSAASTIARDLVVRSTAQVGIRQALAKEVDLAQPDGSLVEVINQLKADTNIPILWDPAITDAGINPEEVRLSVVMKGPLCQVLDRALGQATGGTELDWTDQDQIVRITTRDAMNERRFVQSYDVSPLVSQGIPVRTIAGMLPEATCYAWDCDEPGTSTINALGNQLIVRASTRQHREIAGVLAGLQMAAKGEADIVFAEEPASTLEVEQALHRPLAVEFPDDTLREIGADVAKELGVPVNFDSSITEAGVNPEEAKVSLTIGAMPADVALGLVLENVEGMELRAVPRQGQILMMTADAANELRTPVIYRIAPFEQAGVVPELIAAITTTTFPWDQDEPGTGTLVRPHPEVLVVRQTAKVHAEIRKLIEEQRKTLIPLTTEERAAREQRLETRIYRLAGEKEEDLVRTIRTTIDPEQWGDENDSKAPRWIRRVLVDPRQPGLPMGGSFAGGMGGGAIGNADGVLPHGGAVEPTAPASASQATTVLVIRQTRAAHRRIDSLIHAIRSTTAASYTRPGGTMAPPTLSYGVEVELP